MNKWILLSSLIASFTFPMVSNASNAPNSCSNPIRDDLKPENVKPVTLKVFAQEMGAIFNTHCNLEKSFVNLSDSDYKQTNKRIVDGIEDSKQTIQQNTNLDTASFEQYLSLLKKSEYITPQNLEINNNAYYDVRREIKFCDRENKACKEFSDKLFELINLPVDVLKEADALRVEKIAVNADIQWKNYLEKSLVQMPWELWLNSKKLDMLRTNPDNPEILLPPEYQYILFRPGVVYDYVSNANDGSQSKATLMLEVVGIDFWQQKQQYLPSGGSVVALYTDRDGVDDVGIGAALRFQSMFVVGVSYYGDGDTGAFLSLDLLELFRDKEQTYKEYIEGFYSK